MANAKKCDRCGKLFEPYIKAEDMRQSKQSDSPGYLNIQSRKIIFKNNHYIEEGNFDLCKECNDSFLKWLSGTNVVKHECLRFGNINKKSNKCKLCPSYQECKKVTKEKKENKQKGCNVFGAFGGTPYCSMCPQCYECREVTNTIKDANSDWDIEGGDANA